MPISLKTIDRRPHDSLPDGALLELINLRYNNGALRPVPEKVRVTPDPPLRVMYRHAISETVHADWGQYDDQGTLYLGYVIYENGIGVSQVLDLRYWTGEVIFSSLGNALVVHEITPELPFIMLFQPDTNSYRVFDKLLPDMPLIQFQRTVNNVDNTTKTVELDDFNPGDSDMGQMVNDAFMGSGQELFMSRNKKGYLIGRYLVRCAWELFDGSIVMHSVPSEFIASEIVAQLENIGSQFWSRVYFDGYKVGYKINLSVSDMTALKAQFAGIVKSFNIYVTNHPELTEMNSATMTWNTWYSMTMPESFTATLENTWISNETNYFQLIKIGLDSLVADAWNYIYLDDTSSLSSSEVLPAGNLSCHSLFSKNLFAYNQRIFMSNVKVTLYDGTNLRGFFFPGSNNISGEAYSLGISFDLDTGDGTKRVFTGWQVLDYYKDDSPDYFQVTIHDFIGYPDARAKSCSIWHKDIGGIIRRLKTFPLNQVFGMNFSFLLPALFLPIDFGVGWPKLTQPGSDWTVDSIGENNTYWDGDRVQACEFSNPYYYPAINSYRVEGIVLGLATNAMPLGPSQFGQFPIFAFTTKGIWTMDIGAGDILISSIRPLSGVICTNSRMILGIDGGVIFMSNEGLMILSGRDAQSISEPLTGTEVSPLAGVLDYEKATNNPNTYQPRAFIDQNATPFGVYATYQVMEAGPRVAFVTVNTPRGTEKEIIVSNSLFNYSYVYNLNSKGWYKITQVWDNFVHDFPKTYGSKIGPTIDDLTQEVTDPDRENPILVHAETRPVKFGEDISHKKLLRTILYGLIKMGSEKPFTFFLFGSVDGEYYFTQQASQIVTPGEKVALGRTGFSCRSFVFVLGGYVYDDTYITGIVSDIEKRYNQKLQ